MRRLATWVTTSLPAWTGRREGRRGGRVSERSVWCRNKDLFNVDSANDNERMVAHTNGQKTSEKRRV